MVEVLNQRENGTEDPEPPPKRRRLRRLLLIAGPIVVLAGALALYLSGGRFVSEEDSYIGAANVAVNAQVVGQVVRVAVGENQAVKKGDLLFEIDPEPYRIALASANAQLGVVKNQIASLLDTYRAQLAEIEEAQANLTYARSQLGRAQDLAGRAITSQASLEAAQRDEQVASDTLKSAQQTLQGLAAQLGGNPSGSVEQQAQFLQAKAAVDSAERNLRLTSVMAPFDGVATQVDSIQVGEYLNPGQAAFNLVSTRDVWVEANIRETDLTFVEVGNPVSVSVDSYPDIVITGAVETISPASGAVFALLPPQNATGNWVKVVQRVPVRVSLRLEPNSPVLRAGMSATVSIDTGRKRTFSGLWGDLRKLVGL